MCGLKLHGNTKATHYELLRECVRRKNPEDHVFTRKNGRPVKDFRDKWRKACLELELARLEPQYDGRSRYVGLVIHDLRRSAVRNLERSGVPRSVAMKITGHKTESVYRRYAIVSEADLADAALKLEQRRGRPSLTSNSKFDSTTRDDHAVYSH